jgi:hypothetical protein
LFDYYVFGEAADPGAHIPPERRGILGKLSADDIERLRAQLAQRLQGPK